MGFEIDEGDATTTFSLQELLKGSAPEERRLTATLTVIAGRGAGQVHRVEHEEIVLGRAPDLAVVIEDDGVSRRHARITAAGGTHLIEDLHSTNGTLVNGTKVVAPIALHDGDRIRIGPHAILKFGYQDELEEQMQAKLYDSATRDPLTQAHNRRYFQERLATEWAFAQRHRAACALIAIDADHFKQVNDTWGHPGGDYVLKELVVAMSKVVRKEDLVARIGGEEFMVLARGTNRPAGVALAERIRAAVEQHPFVFEGQPRKVTVSLGVSTSDDLGVEEPDDLVGRADDHLYRAKENGRNRVEPPPERVLGK
jgi:diguanylate cyclase (GGDEF)-like protein